MSRIAISFCGEGRGHASRAISLIEILHPKHSLLFLSFGEGREYLSSYITEKNLNIPVVSIKGIKYQYRSGRLNAFLTYLHWAKFMFFRIDDECRNVTRILKAYDPDLAVVDFEPCLPRVAACMGVPCISVDHQNFIRFCRHGEFLPILLRIRAIIGGLVCKLYIPKADLYVISSFFTPTLNKSKKDSPCIMRVGPIVRKELKVKTTSNDNIILSYLRKTMPDNVRDAFLKCGYPVIVYGLGKAKRIENIIFKQIMHDEFVKDLARATAVVGAGGNQLIGESLFLGKPYLALPERDHHEQVMNCYYLKKMGQGDFIFLEEFNQRKLVDFMNDVERLKGEMSHHKTQIDGNKQIQTIIESFMTDRGLISG